MNTILSTAFIILNGACVALICLFWLEVVLEKDGQTEQAKRVEELITKEMESTE